MIRRGHVVAGLLVLLASGMASAQYRPRYSRNVGSTNSRFLNWTAENYAFFEFAPSSGAGMGVACAGTTPTGAKGEVLTFTRASARSCMKGSESTGIAAGDLVMLASGQPAVMPGGDGTGGLGLGVWEARTNSATYSEQFDHAAWTKAGNGGGVLPVVTANAGTAPDGTLTAERVQFSACPTTGDDSTVYQNTSVATATSSVYVKGVSGSGSISVCQYNHPISPACITCAFNSTTWARCSGPPTAAGGTYILFGCENNTAVYPGGSNTGAADVYLWGAQHEAGATVSPYIKTEGTAQTRVAEVASVAASPASIATGSLFTTWVAGGDALTNDGWIGASTGSAIGQAVLYFSGNKSYVGGVSTNSAAGLLGAGTHRLGLWWSAAESNLIVNGTTTGPGAAGTPSAVTKINVGNYGAAGTEIQNGVYKRICYDVDSARCR